MAIVPLTEGEKSGAEALRLPADLYAAAGASWVERGHLTLGYVAFSPGRRGFRPTHLRLRRDVRPTA